MEQDNLLNEFTEPVYEPATVGQRLANYLIDVVIFYIVVLILSVPLGMAIASGTGGGGLLALSYLISFAAFFAYYIFFEGSKGKTVGKMVTKTKVITDDGTPMTYGKAAMRTLCRIVPFEFISAFLDTTMWHDKWTKTRVVRER